MYSDSFGRLWKGPYQFNLGAITTHAPRTYGVYEILYSGERMSRLKVAYIGIATGDTIYGRLRKHCTGSGNWALARLGDPSSFSFVFYECDKASAKQIESYTVTWSKPPFNTRPEYKHLIPSIAVH